MLGLFEAHCATDVSSELLGLPVAVKFTVPPTIPLGPPETTRLVSVGDCTVSTVVAITLPMVAVTVHVPGLLPYIDPGPLTVQTFVPLKSGAVQTVPPVAAPLNPMKVVPAG